MAEPEQTENMDESSSWWLQLWAFAKYLWRLVMPSPVFGSPTAEITSEEERDWQWFHIPVSVKWRWLRRYIPRCRAVAVFVSGQYAGQEFPLRWQSDLPKASSEITLIFGQKSLIPFVVRRDKSTGATLTDNEFFLRGETRLTVFGIAGEDNILLARTTIPPSPDMHHLNPGEHKVKIKIISGHLSWESPCIYTINVPDSSSTNSHFFCNME